jgi:hypothetical protein
MASKKEPPKQLVASAEPMLIMYFRQHVLKRHPMMRFVTKQEHTADHRMRGDLLDHTHEVPEEVPPQQEGEEDATHEGP